MTMRISAIKKIIVVFTIIVLFVPSGFASTEYTIYRNDRWGFCLRYPRTWLSYEGVNRSGISLKLAKYDPTTISIGALRNGDVASDSDRPLSIDEYADEELSISNLSEFIPRKKIKILYRENIMFKGAPAIKAVINFLVEGRHFEDEYIYAIKDNKLYSFEYEKSYNDGRLYDRPFEAILGTFEWSCGRK